MSETILSDPAWEDPALCPTCDRAGDASLLDHVRYKLAAFDTVEQTSKAVSDAWSTKGWNQLDALENLARLPEEPAALALARSSGAEGRLSAETARALTEWVELLVARANAKVEALGQAKVALERSLPEKLTAVVEKAEAARRLQTNLRDLRTANNELEAVSAELARIARVKAFLDTACSAFATAESNAGARRLAAIEPATRSIFAAIMFSDVVPALKKRAGSEDLLISLANFWSLTDVSAQAVLSESYRNAFAISVDLAAALNSP